MSEKVFQIIPIIGITVIGMRSGYGMRDPVGNCHAAHFDGDVPGFGAVIDLRQYVTVDVEHVTFLDSRTECRMSLFPQVGARCVESLSGVVPSLFYS